MWYNTAFYESHDEAGDWYARPEESYQDEFKVWYNAQARKRFREHIESGKATWRGPKWEDAYNAWKFNQLQVESGGRLPRKQSTRDAWEAIAKPYIPEHGQPDESIHARADSEEIDEAELLTDDWYSHQDLQQTDEVRRRAQQIKQRKESVSARIKRYSTLTTIDQLETLLGDAKRYQIEDEHVDELARAREMLESLNRKADEERQVERQRAQAKRPHPTAFSSDVDLPRESAFRLEGNRIILDLDSP
jgi:hypothetical protein